MITTTVHAYSYDTTKQADMTAWAALCARMASQGTKCFESWGGGSSHYQPKLDNLVVTLETDHLFDNQWSTAPITGLSDKGYRLFDWALDYQPHAKYLKRGHWLELTPDMIAIRADRLQCGYCGKQYNVSDPTTPKFCTACLGSQYLKSTELHLTRIVGIGFHAKRAPLTPDELAVVLPIYQAEQSGCGSERAIKAYAAIRARLDKDFTDTTTKAAVKHKAMVWLMDHGCSIRLLEDVIYYDHRHIFTFGWSKPLDAGLDLDWLLEHLSEFPYEYEIKTTHRGTLSGRE